MSLLVVQSVSEGKNKPKKIVSAKIQESITVTTSRNLIVRDFVTLEPINILK